MAQQTINNGDAGLDARTKINTNFLELYTGKIGTATAGTNITWTVNSNGISINNPAWLTTARASNDGIGLNTAQTNVTWTINSSGISFNAAGYAGTQTAATNATFTLNSQGLSLSVDPGGGGLTNIRLSAGGQSSLASTVYFSNSNGVSFGLDTINQAFTASIDTSAALTNIKVSAGTSSGLRSDITFTNQNGVSFGMNAVGIISASVNTAYAGLNTAATNVTWTVNSSGISFNAGGYAGTTTGAQANMSITLNSQGISISTTGGNVTYTGFNPFPGAQSVTGQQGAGTLYLYPFQAPSFQYDRICLPIQISNASNSSNSATLSMSVGIYTRMTGASTASLSLYASASGSFAWTASGTVGSYSQWGGVRLMTIPQTNTMPAGNYWMGIWSRTTTGGGAGQTVNQMLNSQIISSYSGILGEGSNNSHLWMIGWGRSSVSFSTAMPNSIPLVDIQGNSSILQRPPIFYFHSSTI